MYTLEQTGQFKKDIKLAKKRGFDMGLLNELVTTLVEQGVLSQKYKPHKLTGNYKGFWECHIQPDWLLIWEQNETIKLVTLTRTGTHSDLF
ncbi:MULTISPECIES: type II toxin-antitoxin system YafQ family toxin [Sphingobacterium]|uniref:Type II toxin-antitoxin system mRNA interferase toxin, RelE/StbE family n=1 Tax=Sphingobacterium athyrii TaxID=2152717 RepID=A0A363NYL3_9SPHI|nr:MULTISPECIES: type II toxin-antitoxin system YafQ family toxin [Sphingobacterium]PUV25904.1 type II toxin-antitoxin system mRNA interferase toxin, RelE/StbE family [Sphingobacterium athyrii]